MKKKKAKSKTFSEKVITWIKKVPAGRVASYGQIARLAGKPHASRGVAWILHSCSTRHNLPWHRILNSKGQISFDPAATNYVRQQKLLEREGVHFLERGRLNLKRYQWKK